MRAWLWIGVSLIRQREVRAQKPQVYCDSLPPGIEQRSEIIVVCKDYYCRAMSDVDPLNFNIRRIVEQKKKNRKQKKQDQCLPHIPNSKLSHNSVTRYLLICPHALVSHQPMSQPIILQLADPAIIRGVELSEDTRAFPDNDLLI